MIHIALLQKEIGEGTYDYDYDYHYYHYYFGIEYFIFQNHEYKRNTDYKDYKSTNVHDMLDIIVQGLSEKAKSHIQSTPPHKYYIN